jgi:hypothetical protein
MDIIFCFFLKSILYKEKKLRFFWF